MKLLVLSVVTIFFSQATYAVGISELCQERMERVHNQKVLVEEGRKTGQLSEDVLEVMQPSETLFNQAVYACMIQEQDRLQRENSDLTSRQVERLMGQYLDAATKYYNSLGQ